MTEVKKETEEKQRREEEQERDALESLYDNLGGKIFDLNYHLNLHLTGTS